MLVSAYACAPGELQNIIYIIVEAVDIALEAFRESAALLIDAAH